MKKLLFPLLLFPMLFGTSSCSKDCGFALCDLVTEVAFSGVLTITAGLPFNIPNAIENLINTTESCSGDILETLGAGESQSLLAIDFDSQNDGSFASSQLNSNFGIPKINPGATVMENFIFSFDEPGDYRLITFADDKNDVEERMEGNNASAPEVVPAGRVTEPGVSITKEPLIIRVLPNPNFQREKGAPYVRLLSRTVTIVE